MAGTARYTFLPLTVICLAIAGAGSPQIASQPTWLVETVDADGKPGVYKSLAFDDSGQPAIAYSSEGGVRMAVWNGSAWDVEIIDPGGGARGVSLAFEPASGAPCVSYITDASLAFACRHDDSWRKSELASGSVTGLNSSLKFDPSGNPAVAFCTGGEGGGLQLASRADAGWTVEVVDPGARAYYLSLAFDGEGRPAIAYGDDTSGASTYMDGVKCARHDGASWSTRVVEGGYEEYAGYSVTLSFDPVSGRAVIYHVCNVYWIGRLATGDGRHVEDAGEARDGQFAFDSIGTPMLAVMADGDLYYYTKSGSEWVEELVDGDGYLAWQPSIAIGPDGRPAIAYHDHHGRSLKLATRIR
jgi:hypothetical protein